MSRPSPSPVDALIMNVSSNARAALSLAASSSSFGRSTRSILLRTASFGLRTSGSPLRIAWVSSLSAGLARLLPGVDQEREHVGVGGRAPGGGDHRPVEAALGREQAGRVDEHDLRLALGQDAAHGRAGRLRLAGDDRHLLADEGVDQRRFSRVRRADERDEAASGLAHVAAPQRSRKACAAACSAARFELAAPSSGSKPSTVRRITKWGACAGPLRSTSS